MSLVARTGQPRSVRLSAEGEEALRRIMKATGLNFSAIIEMVVRDYARRLDQPSNAKIDPNTAKRTRKRA